MRLEYKWFVGIVFVMALFLDLLDASIVVVAVPTLAAEFGAATTAIEWVVTGYLLSLAVFIPFSGWLGDRFGTKKVFIAPSWCFLPVRPSPASPGTSSPSSPSGCCRV